MHARKPTIAICLLVAAAIPALCGEEDGQKSFYGDCRWQDAQRYAAAAKLVVIGKAVEAKPAKGKGWNGSNNPVQAGSGRMPTCTIHVDQEVAVEVTEVLRGELVARALTLRLGKVTMDYSPVQQFWYGLYRAKKLKSRNRSLPVKYFSIRKGLTYVLFLKGAEGGGGDNGGEKPPTAAHVDGATPIEQPDAELLRSLRGFCKELTLWDKPPALPEDQRKAVEKLIAELGADDYEVREKAEDALTAVGARIRPYLERAGRDGDEERSFRARQILARSKPEPGKVEVPGAGVGQKAPAIFRERPKPKPPPEPAPPPVPEDDEAPSGENR